MSTPLAAGMILAARVWTSDAEQAAVNTYHYTVRSVGALPSTDQDVADTIDNAINATYKALMSVLARYRGVQVQIIFPLPPRVDVQQVANAGAGTAGAITSAKQVTGLISWYTLLAGRAFRGRNYLPFVSNSSVATDGIPTAGYVTNLQTLAVALDGVTAIAIGGRTATVQMGIYHRATHSMTDVNTFVPQQKFATQKRRGAYGKPNLAPF